MSGAAPDARETPVATRHATRTRELTAGPTADARDAALPARSTAGAAVLAAGTTGAVGAAASARVLLVDDMSGCRACGSAHIRLSCRNRHHCDRCSNSTTNDKRFHDLQFR